MLAKSQYWLAKKQWYCCLFYPICVLVNALWWFNPWTYHKGTPLCASRSTESTTCSFSAPKSLLMKFRLRNTAWASQTSAGHFSVMWVNNAINQPFGNCSYTYKNADLDMVDKHHLFGEFLPAAWLRANVPSPSCSTFTANPRLSLDEYVHTVYRKSTYVYIIQMYICIEICGHTHKIHIYIYWEKTRYIYIYVI